MLGESMTEEQFELVDIHLPAPISLGCAHGRARAGVFHLCFSHPREDVRHSTLRTSACGKFHSHVPSQLCDCLLSERCAADPQALVRRKEKEGVLPEWLESTGSF